MRTRLLSEVLASARTAVLSRGLETPLEISLKIAEGNSTLKTLQAVPEAYSAKSYAPSTLTVNAHRAFATAEAVRGSVKLTRGAAKLWALVHDLGVRAAEGRKYHQNASQVVISLPQSLAAWGLDYTDRHVRNLQAELESAGLCAAHAFAAVVEGKNMWASTLWAIKLTTRATTPHLTSEDFAHKWRDFAADLKAKNTVQHMISGLYTSPVIEKQIVLRDVVTLGKFNLSLSRYLLERKTEKFSLQDSIYRLTLLTDCHGNERQKTVEELALSIAAALNDTHSFAWWCKRLWACIGSWESVGMLQAALGRLKTDLDEWRELRNGAALFNFRNQAKNP
ncbi:hypothetical protein [Deinococcus ruber]|uniref:Uncharacterized protein n=1 Tax=Deinococcus ruber TaxID=1848197 RepID=A0A918KXN3_9DEIO|nr:hypothetical protein [Deinococcus ruber]GGR40892.1 hypothetical protein GCM10008957_56450 [Deinococcus ruber]